jgi:hypothetical protein
VRATPARGAIPAALLRGDVRRVLERERERLRASFGGRSFSIFFVPLEGSAEAETPDGVPYQLSGNNDDGVIVTLWETRR